MADIELIVKIDADVYTRLFDNGIQDNEIATDDICEMARALRLGKPLPKGHGRLKDYDGIANRYSREVSITMSEGERLDLLCGIVDDAETVIKADREAEHDKN
jgi:hypothetical protein